MITLRFPVCTCSVFRYEEQTSSMLLLTHYVGCLQDKRIKCFHQTVCLFPPGQINTLLLRSPLDLYGFNLHSRALPSVWLLNYAVSVVLHFGIRSPCFASSLSATQAVWLEGRWCQSAGWSVAGAPLGFGLDWYWTCQLLDGSQQNFTQTLKSESCRLPGRGFLRNLLQRNKGPWNMKDPSCKLVRSQFAPIRAKMPDGPPRSFVQAFMFCRWLCKPFLLRHRQDNIWISEI